MLHHRPEAHIVLDIDGDGEQFIQGQGVGRVPGTPEVVHDFQGQVPEFVGCGQGCARGKMRVVHWYLLCSKGSVGVVGACGTVFIYK